MAVSFIATGIVWRWLTNPAPHERAGGLNLLFDHVGLGFLANDWWQNPTWGMAAMAIPAIWQMSGYVMALFLAGLRGVPEEQREAARVDGAGLLRTYRSVILPLSAPAFAVTLIWQFTSMWNDFLFAAFLTGPASWPATVRLNNIAGSMAAASQGRRRGAVRAGGRRQRGGRPALPEVERRILNLFALQGPVAVDLRLLSA
jgi:ABC-type sugar transport system permease subunit